MICVVNSDTCAMRSWYAKHKLSSVLNDHKISLIHVADPMNPSSYLTHIQMITNYRDPVPWTEGKVAYISLPWRKNYANILWMIFFDSALADHDEHAVIWIAVSSSNVTCNQHRLERFLVFEFISLHEIFWTFLKDTAKRLYFGNRSQSWTRGPRSKPFIVLLCDTHFGQCILTTSIRYLLVIMAPMSTNKSQERKPGISVSEEKIATKRANRDVVNTVHGLEDYNQTLAHLINCLEECIKHFERSQKTNSPRKKGSLERTDLKTHMTQRFRELWSVMWASARTSNDDRMVQVRLRIKNCKDQLPTLHEEDAMMKIHDWMILQAEFLRDKVNIVGESQQLSAITFENRFYLSPSFIRSTKTLLRALDDCVRLGDEFFGTWRCSPLSYMERAYYPVCRRGFRLFREISALSWPDHSQSERGKKSKCGYRSYKTHQTG